MPAPIVLLCVFIWYVFTTPYELLKQEQINFDKIEKENQVLEEKIRPKLSILFEQGEEPFFQIKDNKNAADRMFNNIGNKDDFPKVYTCRFGIINNEVNVLRNAQAKVYPTDSTKNKFKDLSINLRFMHDPKLKFSHKSQGIVLDKKRDLQPNNPEYVDVLKYIYNPNDKESNYLSITHLNPDEYSNNPVIQTYDFEVRISSDAEGESITRFFRFDPDAEENNMWRMLLD
jgi:hypothetical protein